MGEKEYLYYFTSNRLDRFRYYHFLDQGRIVRFIFYGYVPEEVLTIGERDIKANWRQYRSEYERELKRNV